MIVTIIGLLCIGLSLFILGSLFSIYCIEYMYDRAFEDHNNFFEVFTNTIKRSFRTIGLNLEELSKERKELEDKYQAFNTEVLERIQKLEQVIPSKIKIAENKKNKK